MDAEWSKERLAYYFSKKNQHALFFPCCPHITVTESRKCISQNPLPAAFFWFRVQQAETTMFERSFSTYNSLQLLWIPRNCSSGELRSLVKISCDFWNFLIMSWLVITVSNIE